MSRRGLLAALSAIGLAAVAALGLAMIWLIMPETRPTKEEVFKPA